VTDPYAPRFGTAFTPWHRWFAWRPTETVDRGWVWLRVVWRRRIHKHTYLDGGGDFWFQTAVDTQEGKR
jgi:hypothetical protein